MTQTHHFSEHSQSTVLDLVGLQIWRGALLLADWLIHNGESLSNDSVILELASGVGLTSIVAAMFTPVICTGNNKRIINPFSYTTETVVYKL